MPAPAHIAAFGALLLAIAPAQNPRAPWRLAEVARAECRGGAFLGASIAADSTRMLTFGEGGVVIEWDLAHARERKRFAALAEPILSVCVHPCDPWAVVIVGRRPHALRLDLGSGRYQRLWSEPVGAVAFDATGARAAVLFQPDHRFARLAVYAEAALRAAQPPAPDLQQSFCDQPYRLFFHPDGSAVFARDSTATRRFPLDGSAASRATAGLCGLLADGTEVVETHDCCQPVTAGMHWLAGSSQLQRGGAAPESWRLDEPYGRAAIAADGTVVAPDERGNLLLLGPEPECRRIVRGQPGPAAQLCFDAAGRHLAIVGGSMLTILDVARGTSTRIDGTYAVQAMPEPDAFALLDGQAVRTIRAADRWRLTLAVVLPDGVAATTFERWPGTVLLRQFRWLPSTRQLWLAHASPPRDDPAPACITDERVRLLGCPPAVDECAYQPGLALGPGRDGDMVLGTAACLSQGTVRREHIRWWSRLQTFDRRGRLRCVRPLPNRIAWMRTSPAGALVAVPGPDGRVCAYRATDLHPIHEFDLGVGEIVAWEFVDERMALASNGASLLQVEVAAGVSKPIAVALPGPITQLCLSPDRRLVAIACGSDVRVLRRQ